MYILLHVSKSFCMWSVASFTLEPLSAFLSGVGERGRFCLVCAISRVIASEDNCSAAQADLDITVLHILCSLPFPSTFLKQYGRHVHTMSCFGRPGCILSPSSFCPPCSSSLVQNSLDSSSQRVHGGSWPAPGGHRHPPGRGG